jgi:hypothetical protein
LVDEGVLCGHQLVLQAIVVRLQDLHQGIQGFILSPVPIEVRAQLGKAIELFARLALQAAAPTGSNKKAEGTIRTKNVEARKKTGKQS